MTSVMWAWPAGRAGLLNRYAGRPAEASRTTMDAMRAMVLDAPGRALRESTVADPAPAAGQVLVKISACALCRTDLHVVDGELTHPKLPLIPGHQIIGDVVQCGTEVESLSAGDRVGIPWLGWTDDVCRYCRAGRENLCDHARFTGYDIDGGYAELTIANEAYCFALPEVYSDTDAAPLMCAGLIGYRSLRMAGDAQRIGIYGFGAAAHIIAQVAIHRGQRVFAFTRPGDAASQTFAREIGA